MKNIFKMKFQVRIKNQSSLSTDNIIQYCNYRFIKIWFTVQRGWSQYGSCGLTDKKGTHNELVKLASTFNTYDDIINYEKIRMKKLN